MCYQIVYMMNQPIKIIFAFFFLYFGFVFLPHAYGQWTIDAETGLAFPANNDVRIFNGSGTLFDFNEEFDVQGPVIPVRVRIGYTFGEKNHVSVLWAPLRVNYEGSFSRPVQFQNTLFPAGDFTKGTYKFNSYRLTYRRDVVQTDRWVLGVGLTGKIRDAKVQLENEAGLSDSNDNVGPVPLLHLYAEYGIGQGKLYFEGDGLASSQGRAFDLFLGASIPLAERLGLKVGYRMLEGGADSEEVYNFALVHYGVIGLVVEL